MGRQRETPQWATDNGWELLRQPHRAHSYAVLHRGRRVGYLLHEQRGWRWRSYTTRNTYGTTQSKRLFPSWSTAAAALARCTFARHINNGQIVGPLRFRPDHLLYNPPWIPAPSEDT